MKTQIEINKSLWESAADKINSEALESIRKKNSVMAANHEAIMKQTPLAKQSRFIAEPPPPEVTVEDLLANAIEQYEEKLRISQNQEHLEKLSKLSPQQLAELTKDLQ